MPVIRPSADLRNKYNEISKICHETNDPVYITKNGAGDLAVKSIELYEQLIEKVERYGKLENAFMEIEAGTYSPIKEILEEREGEGTD